MATITENLPTVGAADASGQDRIKDALISGNILFVSKGGSDTGGGNFGTPFLTIQKAIDTHGDPTDAADEKITKVIWIESGQYDEALTLRGAGSFLFLFNGPVVLGDGAGAQNEISGTPRDITWTVDNTKVFVERPSVTFKSLNAMFSTTGDAAFAQSFIISGNFIISDTNAQKSQLYLDGVKLQGNLDLTSWDNDRLDVYIRDTIFKGTFGGASGADVHLMSAENSEFVGLIHVHKYGRFIDCQLVGGMTLNSSNGAGAIETGVPPAGFINSDLSGTFTGPAGSFLLIDSLTNRYLIDNSATLTTIVKRFQDQNSHREESYSLTIASGAITPDLQRGSIVDVVADENITVNNPVNAFEGALLEIRFSQDSTGGFTYTLGAEFSEGTTVTISDLNTTLSKTHRALWERRGSKWELLAISNDL